MQLAALIEFDLPTRPALLGPALQVDDRLRGARRLTLCPGVEVVLDLWKIDPDVFRPRRFPYPSWHGRARCRGVGYELFFRGSTVGPPTRRRSLREARSFCHSCPVRRDCLSQAFSIPEHFGVWGGISARQRKPLLLAVEAGTLSVEEAVDTCLTAKTS